jgi:hypothetical protein
VSEDADVSTIKLPYSTQRILDHIGYSEMIAGNPQKY